MMGKYLNGYLPSVSPHRPAGWNEWDVAGNGYPEFNYNLNENGRLVHYAGAAERLPDRRAGAQGVRASSTQAADTGRPFVLELATFAPHAPYTPAPRNANDFPGLRAPRPPSFNARQRQPAALAARPGGADRRSRSPASTRPSAGAPRRSRPSTT